MIFFFRSKTSLHFRGKLRSRLSESPSFWQSLSQEVLLPLLQHFYYESLARSWGRKLPIIAQIKHWRQIHSASINILQFVSSISPDRQFVQYSECPVTSSARGYVSVTGSMPGIMSQLCQVVCLSDGQYARGYVSALPGGMSQ